MGSVLWWCIVLISAGSAVRAASCGLCGKEFRSAMNHSSRREHSPCRQHKHECLPAENAAPTHWTTYSSLKKLYTHSRLFSELVRDVHCLSSVGDVLWTTIVFYHCSLHVLFRVGKLIWNYIKMIIINALHALSLKDKLNKHCNGCSSCDVSVVEFL